MNKLNKVRLKILAKRIGLIYLGLMLGGGLLYLDSRSWLLPLKQVNGYRPQMEALVKAQSADGSVLDRCLFQRNGSQWNTAATNCLINSELRMTTGYGRAMLAGYLSEAGGDREQRVRLLSRAIDDIRKERDMPWNALLREAQQACHSTFLTCLAEDLDSTPHNYDRMLDMLAAELAKVAGKDL